MIYPEKGKERECFIDFVEKALGILAKEKYRDFLAAFDRSRILTEQDLIFALQYLVAVSYTHLTLPTMATV